MKRCDLKLKRYERYLKKIKWRFEKDIDQLKRFLNEKRQICFENFEKELSWIEKKDLCLWIKIHLIFLKQGFQKLGILEIRVLNMFMQEIMN